MVNYFKKKNIITVFSITTMLVILVAFQNCGRVNFSRNNPSGGNANVSPITSELLFDIEYPNRVQTHQEFELKIQNVRLSLNPNVIVTPSSVTWNIGGTSYTGTTVSGLSMNTSQSLQVFVEVFANELRSSKAFVINVSEERLLLFDVDYPQQAIVHTDFNLSVVNVRYSDNPTQSISPNDVHWYIKANNTIAGSPITLNFSSPQVVPILVEVQVGSDVASKNISITIKDEEVDPDPSTCLDNSLQLGIEGPALVREGGVEQRYTALLINNSIEDCFAILGYDWKITKDENTRSIDPIKNTSPSGGEFIVQFLSSGDYQIDLTVRYKEKQQGPISSPYFLTKTVSMKVKVLLGDEPTTCSYDEFSDMNLACEVVQVQNETDNKGPGVVTCQFVNPIVYIQPPRPMDIRWSINKIKGDTIEEIPLKLGDDFKVQYAFEGGANYEVIATLQKESCSNTKNLSFKFDAGGVFCPRGQSCDNSCNIDEITNNNLNCYSNKNGNSNQLSSTDSQNIICNFTYDQRAVFKDPRYTVNKWDVNFTPLSIGSSEPIPFNEVAPSSIQFNSSRSTKGEFKVSAEIADKECEAPKTIWTTLEYIPACEGKDCDNGKDRYEGVCSCEKPNSASSFTQDSGHDKERKISGPITSFAPSAKCIDKITGEEVSMDYCGAFACTQQTCNNTEVK